MHGSDSGIVQRGGIKVGVTEVGVRVGVGL